MKLRRTKIVPFFWPRCIFKMLPLYIAKRQSCANHGFRHSDN